MSDAIEVLKDRVETIKLVHKEILDEKKWRDFLGEDITFERRDAINKRINALGEAIVALEKLEKISFILETRIEDVEENIDCLEQELKTLGKEDEIIETELTAYQDHLEDLKEIEKELGGKE